MEAAQIKRFDLQNPWKSQDCEKDSRDRNLDMERRGSSQSITYVKCVHETYYVRLGKMVTSFTSRDETAVRALIGMIACFHFAH